MCFCFCSILVSSLEWSRIRPNLPWLVESGGCFLLDSFVSFFYVSVFKHIIPARDKWILCDTSYM